MLVIKNSVLSQENLTLLGLLLLIKAYKLFRVLMDLFRGLLLTETIAFCVNNNKL